MNEETIMPPALDVESRAKELKEQAETSLPAVRVFEEIMLQLKDGDYTDFPTVIKEQATSLSRFAKQKDEALKRAEEAKIRAEEAAQIKWHWYKSDKEILDKLQTACKAEGEALDSISQALEIAFKNQQKMQETSKLLLGLGLTNTVLNRMVITQLEEKLQTVSEDELNELARAELISVVRQLKAQEDIQNRLDKQKETLEHQEFSIEEAKSELSRRLKRIVTFLIISTSVLTIGLILSFLI